MDFNEKLGVIRENLRRTDTARIRGLEIRVSHLNDLADAIARSPESGDSPEELRELYALAVGVSRDEVYPDNMNRSFVAGFDLHFSVLERIYLCRRIASVSGMSFLAVSPDGEGANRISYLRNSYADAAYAAFSSVLTTPSVTYCRDFTGVCEDVYYGRTKYCILPIENTADGTLPGFRRLIAKYELKMALTCSVETSGSGVAKFALLKKNIGRTEVPAKAVSGAYFDFTVNLRDDGSASSFGLGDLLTAAGLCGMRLCKIDSLPTEYPDEYSYELLLSDSGDLEGFLAVLTLETPGFTPVGIFSHLAPR